MADSPTTREVEDGARAVVLLLVAFLASCTGPATPDEHEWGKTVCQQLGSVLVGIEGVRAPKLPGGARASCANGLRVWKDRAA